MSRPRRVLVDMDGVLANLLGAFARQCKDRGLATVCDPMLGTHWVLEDYLEPRHQDAVGEILGARGFFASLPAIPGAIVGVREMVHRGIDVRICTSLFAGNDHCIGEKLSWIREHLGDDLAEHVVFARDKTAVKADLLFDDKPEITGRYRPEWTHVVYAHAYNEHVTDRRRLTWANWREMLDM